MIFRAGPQPFLTLSANLRNASNQGSFSLAAQRTPMSQLEDELLFEFRSLVYGTGHGQHQPYVARLGRKCRVDAEEWGSVRSSTACTATESA
jgi:hypothetical protein